MRTSPTLGVTGAVPLAPPVGTRDLLPPEASARRALVRKLAAVLELHGYALVTTPPFERAEIIERASEGDPREMLRFVDPETSEVAVFRPDLTLQVARVVATRLTDRPGPHRLYYEGHVIRARRGRARRRRQIAQVGAECIGIPGSVGDAETISLASRALDAAGLAHTIEIAIVPLVRALTASLDPARRAIVTEALGHKDQRAIELALAGASLSKPLQRALVALPQLTGDASVLLLAERTLRAVDTIGHLAQVRSLRETLDDRGLTARLRFDLGEVRGFGYYTGPSFSLLAEGPGEPLGGGGRYDDLLGRFGRSTPATGFAIDVDHLAWAITAQGGRAAESGSSPRVCIAAPSGARGAGPLEALRRAGVSVGELPGASAADAVAYARAWSLDAAIEVHANGRASVHWIEAHRVDRCTITELADRLVRPRAPRESRA